MATTTTPGRPAATHFEQRKPKSTITLLTGRRRRGQRVEVSGKVQFRTGCEGSWQRANVTQLSCNGMLVEHTAELDVGSALAGVLRAKDAPPVEFLGEVTRRVDDEMIAVRFLYLAEPDKTRLAQVICRNARPKNSWTLGERKTATTLPLWPLRD